VHQCESRRCISAEWKAEMDAMLLHVRARLLQTPAHPLPIAQHSQLPVRALTALARSHGTRHEDSGCPGETEKGDQL
jgi:hypothetical protein